MHAKKHKLLFSTLLRVLDIVHLCYLMSHAANRQCSPSKVVSHGTTFGVVTFGHRLWRKRVSSGTLLFYEGIC